MCNYEFKPSHKGVSWVSERAREWSERVKQREVERCGVSGRSKRLNSPLGNCLSMTIWHVLKQALFGVVDLWNDERNCEINPLALLLPKHFSSSWVRQSNSITVCVRLLVCLLVTHSFDDPHDAPCWPTWPCFFFVARLLVCLRWCWRWRRRWGWRWRWHYNDSE